VLNYDSIVADGEVEELLPTTAPGWARARAGRGPRPPPNPPCRRWGAEMSGFGRIIRNESLLNPAVLTKWLATAWKRHPIGDETL
jgi:hypothetical protein